MRPATLFHRLQLYLNHLTSKFAGLLQSRKFWALIASLVAISQALSLGEISHWQALQAAITALAAYSVGTALEDSGHK